MKTCSKCGEVKAVSEFHKDSSRLDGLYHVCKSCEKVRAKAKYERVGRAYYRLQMRGWRADNPERNRENGRLQKARQRAKGGQEYLRKQRAHHAVSAAVKSGAISRPGELWCSRCDDAAAAEYHHPDYSKPLDVVPLCIMCHSDVHRLVSDEKS